MSEYTDEQIKEAYEKSLAAANKREEGSPLMGCIYGLFILFMMADILFLNLSVIYLIYKMVSV